MATVGLAGGDARYIEVMTCLQDAGFSVYAAGFEQLNQVPARRMSLEDLPWASLDGLVLPLGGILHQGEIESVFTKDTLQLEAEDVKKTPPSCRIFTGVPGPDGERFAREVNRKLIPVMYRDDAAVYNAIPTSEGILYILLKHTDRTIHNANITVFGFGRLGVTLVRSLLAIGANVNVVVHTDAEAARAYEMKAHPFFNKEAAKAVQSADMIVNTAPALVLPKEVIAHVPVHTFVIDAASAPGGIDFAAAKKRGLQTLHAPGLPGKVAPKSAGRILGRLLVKLLTEPEERR
ncbi:dipicolinate synthase subunit A [Salsuginibacillus halophilus]|uniref:Dipicolinate synthase subunit A n=1 Tax=Salsuginibacillus halophilus TaxID=517424 RepID=A0A2P8HYD1_9BACI|nr:dipicolinate synthase subunit DpsA [Salsuginibacillus halophilus]PSL51241.1 dipicolinate synthase subunit A [Salsuginibacillus halophilus]